MTEASSHVSWSHELRAGWPGATGCSQPVFAARRRTWKARPAPGGPWLPLGGLNRYPTLGVGLMLGA
jgi:hypothetical protein